MHRLGERTGATDRCVALAGLELVDPGYGDRGPRIVWTPAWHPDGEVHAPEQAVAYAAVARKP